jgi:hypothetical protein
VAVLDSQGKLLMESILETKASTILEFFAGLRGALLVTFEEGTWAAWLYDLFKPHVNKLVVSEASRRLSCEQHVLVRCQLGSVAVCPARFIAIRGV